ncbi:paramyosin-like [Homarus americanus]|uniref:paramyosin-like n=1 Tax=Homarus americanus TaxID=6706 RepID=UPI001C4472ED|nr:paramyosin-like [Homarus americanus]
MLQGTMLTTVMVAMVLVALLGHSATGAALQQQHQHRHQRRRDHVAHLQDTVDRLLLQQKIDRILLDNLQKAVHDIQNSKISVGGGSHDAPTEAESTFSASIKVVEAEGLALATLGERVKEMRGTMTEAIQSEEHRDDMTQLRQELSYLRSEVQRLKATRASEGEASAAHVQAQEQRESVTAAWAVDNVRRLQDSVAELQQSLNVTQAFHDKQEVESRLLVLTKDVSALRGTLAAVTSKAEAAAATSTALQEELTRMADDQHRMAGQVGALSTEVTSIREDFNDLLKALPEGTVAGTPVSSSPPGDKKAVGGATEGVVAAVARASQGRQAKRISALEQRADSFDFALTRSQKKLSSLSPGSGSDERLAEVAEAERQLETKVEAATTGVGEVKSSSVKLLAALEDLEARLEKEVTEMKQEVAKLEFTVAQSAAERQNGEDDARVAHDDTSALRTDLQAVSRRLDQLNLKTAAIEGRKLDDEVSVAQCRTQQLTLDLRMNDTLERLQHVEERLRRSHAQGGHSHYLRPWRDSVDDTLREVKRKRRDLSPSG